MKNGRRKGAEAERLAAHLLTDIGFPAERSARNGVKGAGDLIVPDLPNVHVEVKHVEGLDLNTKRHADAMTQAFTDCKSKRHCLLWRVRGKWCLTFTARHPPLWVTVEQCRIKEALLWLNGATA